MVRQLINSNGNPNANQFVISTCNGLYFQSYDSVVAKVDNDNKLILSADWDYSNTTRKHLYTFLRRNGFSHLSSRSEMLKAIKNKEVILKKVSSLKIV